MARRNDQEMAIAGVYAAAMLDLAEERGQGEALGEELRGLAAALERDPDLAAFFTSPLVDHERRAAVLDRALRGRASALFADSLQVMNRKRRLGLLPALAEAYGQALEERRGRIDVQVRSAIPLTDGLRAALQQATARYTGKEPRLMETVDPSLIGGVVLSVGGNKIDGSVAAALRRLQDSLLARGDADIQSGRLHTAP